MSLPLQQEELIANIASALDVGKFTNVFTSLLTIINEQQVKIEKSELKIEELSIQLKKYMKKQDKLEEIQAKIPIPTPEEFAAREKNSNNNNSDNNNNAAAANNKKGNTAGPGAVKDEDAASKGDGSSEEEQQQQLLLSSEEEKTAKKLQDLEERFLAFQNQIEGAGSIDKSVLYADLPSPFASFNKGLNDLHTIHEEDDNDGHHYHILEDPEEKIRRRLSKMMIAQQNPAPTLQSPPVLLGGPSTGVDEGVVEGGVKVEEREVDDIAASLAKALATYEQATDTAPFLATDERGGVTTATGAKKTEEEEEEDEEVDEEEDGTPLREKKKQKKKAMNKDSFSSSSSSTSSFAAHRSPSKTILLHNSHSHGKRSGGSTSASSPPSNGKQQQQQQRHMSLSSASSGHGSFSQGQGPGQQTQPRSKRMSIAIKRHMSLAHLPFLDADRCLRIIKDLRSRGRFLLISKRMLEDTQRKYANQSLKNKIEFLEADIQRLYVRFAYVRDAVKKNNMALREGLPVELRVLLGDLEELFVGLDRHLGVAGDQAEGQGGGGEVSGQNQNKGSIQALLALVGTLKDIQLEKFTEEGLPRLFFGQIIQHLEKTALQEMKNSTLSKFLQHEASMKDFLTKLDVAQMLKVSTALDPNTDANHLKLIHLIEKTTAKQLEAMQHLQEETVKKMNRQLEELKLETMHTLDENTKYIELYADSKIKDMEHDLSRTRDRDLSAKQHVDEELVLLKAKVKRLENTQHDQDESTEQQAAERKYEQEQMRILQKRIQAISIDKLTDELKVIKQDLHKRPTNDQVDSLMQGIEGTFKRYLGENVTGMTNLVSHIYRYLQTKVDREDIRALVQSKLVQMEKELIYREEQMFEVTTSTRCLSCGQLPAPVKSIATKPSMVSPSLPAVGSVVGVSMGNGHGNNNGQQPTKVRPATSHGGGGGGGAGGGAGNNAVFLTGQEQQPTAAFDDNDDGSDVHHNNHQMQLQLQARGGGGTAVAVLYQGSNGHNPSITLSPYSSLHSEQVYSILTGQVGLRPLQLAHQPLQPLLPLPNPNPATGSKNNNNSNARPVTAAAAAPPSSTSTSSRKRSSGTTTQRMQLPPPSSSEPLYRRAKMAQQMKDMVKLTAAQADLLGYPLQGGGGGVAVNPLYVLDGHVHSYHHQGQGQGGQLLGGQQQQGQLQHPLDQAASSMMSSLGGNGVGSLLLLEDEQDHQGQQLYEDYALNNIDGQGLGLGNQGCYNNGYSHGYDQGQDDVRQIEEETAAAMAAAGSIAGGAGGDSFVSSVGGGGKGGGRAVSFHAGGGGGAGSGSGSSVLRSSAGSIVLPAIISAGAASNRQQQQQQDQSSVASLDTN